MGVRLWPTVQSWRAGLHGLLHSLPPRFGISYTDLPRNAVLHTSLDYFLSTWRQRWHTDGVSHCPTLRPRIGQLPSQQIPTAQGWVQTVPSGATDITVRPGNPHHTAPHTPLPSQRLSSLSNQHFPPQMRIWHIIITFTPPPRIPRTTEDSLVFQGCMLGTHCQNRLQPFQDAYHPGEGAWPARAGLWRMIVQENEVNEFSVKSALKLRVQLNPMRKRVVFWERLLLSVQETKLCVCGCARIYTQARQCSDVSFHVQPSIYFFTVAQPSLFLAHFHPSSIQPSFPALTSSLDVSLGVSLSFPTSRFTSAAVLSSLSLPQYVLYNGLETALSRTQGNCPQQDLKDLLNSF